MDDLHSRFRRLDLVEAPDLWREATLRATATRQADRPSTWLLIAAVALLLALIAGGVAVAGGLVHLPWDSRRDLPPTVPTLSWEELPIPANPGQSLLYAGDHYVMYGNVNGVVSSSPDGREWQPAGSPVAGLGSATLNPASVDEWDGSIVTWNGRDLLAHRSDGSSTSLRTDGGITDAAIGPAGIIVFARSALSADPQDVGWFSQSGDSWTQIPRPPQGVAAVAASKDGFFARTSDHTVWHSANGLEWQAIGRARAVSGDLITWRDGVLSLGTGVYEYWTVRGSAWFVSKGAQGSEICCGITDAGPLGIVSVNRAANRILFTTDGATWAASTLPGDRVWYSSGWHPDAAVAVGPDAVLVMLWKEGPDVPGVVPSLWRGTLK